MDFITTQKEVAAQLGMDYLNSDTATLLKRWINLAYQDIVGYTTWEWLNSREAVVMAVDYTTGTVSATASGATITFSATIAATQAGRYIQFSSADDWYLITAHTAGADTATISPAYIQTSNLTAGTFIIRTLYYSLSSSAEYVYSAKQAATPRFLDVIDARSYDISRPFPTDTGDTTTIIFWGQDSSGNWQFTPFPSPDSPILLEFRIKKRVSLLSSDTETYIFPTRFESILITGALRYGYRFLDDSRENKQESSFYALLDDMKTKDEPGLSKHRILQSIDSGGSAGGTIIPFPPEFGVIR